MLAEYLFERKVGFGVEIFHSAYLFECKDSASASVMELAPIAELQTILCKLT